MKDVRASLGAYDHEVSALLPQRAAAAVAAPSGDLLELAAMQGANPTLESHPTYPATVVKRAF
jgi:hypothetical protein